MTPAGSEALLSALRRSIPLIILAALIGVAAMNGLRQLQGDRFSASARVLINPSPLSRILTNTQPGFTDPTRTLETAQSLATSREVYESAAQSLGSDEDASALKSATTVSAESSTDLLTFTSEATEAGTAQDITNAVADAYAEFRGELSQAGIGEAADRLRGTLDALPRNDPDRRGLIDQLSRVELLQSLNSSDAQVVDRATSASQISPTPIRDSILGLSIGLIVALIAVAIREAVDTKVRSTEEIERELDLPIIASIPTLPRGRRLVTYGRDQANFSDAYELLAAQVEPRRIDLGRGVIAITSALPKEGKTTTAANLAVAFARRGNDVILADFDFRAASLGDVFGAPPDTPGAASAIDDTGALARVLTFASLDGPRPTLTRTSESPGGRLRILFTGGLADTPEQPVPTSKLAALIGALRSEGQLVILDTPPVLLTAEIKDLSPYIDTVLLCVRQGRITQRGLQALGRQSRTWETRIAGTVLTDVGAEQAPYPYPYRQ